VRLSGVNASVNDLPAAGHLEIDLARAAPHYRFTGKLEDVAYKRWPARISMAGWRATASARNWPQASTAEGSLHGRSITFAPDADFRSIAGCFEMAVVPAGLRWKLSGLKSGRGGETYFGQGSTQAGRPSSPRSHRRGRQFRYTGSTLALAPQ